MRLKRGALMKKYSRPFCSPERGDRVVWEMAKLRSATDATTRLTTVDFPVPEGAEITIILPALGQVSGPVALLKGLIQCSEPARAPSRSPPSSRLPGERSEGRPRERHRSWRAKCWPRDSSPATESRASCPPPSSPEGGVGPAPRGSESASLPPRCQPAKRGKLPPAPSERRLAPGYPACRARASPAAVG